jgi:hypothetical protein
MREISDKFLAEINTLKDVCIHRTRVPPLPVTEYRHTFGTVKGIIANNKQDLNCPVLNL